MSSKINEDFRAGGDRAKKAAGWIESKSSAFLNQSQIASLCGMSGSGFSDMLNRHEAAKAALQRGKSKTVETLSLVAIEKAQAGDAQMLALCLKSQAGWQEKNSIDHTSSDGSMSPKGRNLDDFYADDD